MRGAQSWRKCRGRAGTRSDLVVGRGGRPRCLGYKGIIPSRHMRRFVCFASAMTCSTVVLPLFPAVLPRFVDAQECASDSERKTAVCEAATSEVVCKLQGCCRWDGDECAVSAGTCANAPPYWDCDADASHCCDSDGRHCCTPPGAADAGSSIASECGLLKRHAASDYCIPLDCIPRSRTLSASSTPCTVAPGRRVPTLQLAITSFQSPGQASFSLPDGTSCGSRCTRAPAATALTRGGGRRVRPAGRRFLPWSVRFLPWPVRTTRRQTTRTDCRGGQGAALSLLGAYHMYRERRGVAVFSSFRRVLGLAYGTPRVRRPSRWRLGAARGCGSRERSFRSASWSCSSLQFVAAASMCR